MTEKRRNELQKLTIAFVLILLFTNGTIATYIRQTIFAKITWEQILLGIIALRIIYILLQEIIFGKKR